MRSTGITRKLDSLGRIVIPKELRTVLSLEDREAVEIFTEGDMIILKKYEPGCMMCGTMDNLKSLQGKQLCSECLKKFE